MFLSKQIPLERVDSCKQCCEINTLPLTELTILIAPVKQWKYHSKNECLQLMSSNNRLYFNEYHSKNGCLQLMLSNNRLYFNKYHSKNGCLQLMFSNNRLYFNKCHSENGYPLLMLWNSRLYFNKYKPATKEI